MDANYDKLIDLINSKNSFLLCSHAHPDGDGIGSTLALGVALKRLGKEVVMYNQDPVPMIIDFLPHANEMVTSVPKDKKFDVSVMLDCSQPDRAGRDFPEKERMGELVCIDHHLNQCEGAYVCCVDDQVSSTGEVVFGLIKRMGLEITADIATHVLTAIIVDTGFFRYSNTNEHCLKLAAELVSSGASTWNISKHMEERIPPEQLKLLSLALDTLDYPYNGKVSVITLTSQMFTQANAGVEMAEDFINFPRSIKDVEVAVLFRQKSDNEYKISFRSKGRIDVAKIAKSFDGGGHIHAAGCSVEGSLGVAKQKVLAAVESALQNINTSI